MNQINLEPTIIIKNEALNEMTKFLTEFDIDNEGNFIALPKLYSLSRDVEDDMNRERIYNNSFFKCDWFIKMWNCMTDNLEKIEKPYLKPGKFSGNFFSYIILFI